MKKRLEKYAIIISVVSLLISLSHAGFNYYQNWTYRTRLTVKITGAWDLANRGDGPKILVLCDVNNPGMVKLPIDPTILLRQSHSSEPVKLTRIPVIFGKNEIVEPDQREPQSIEAGETIQKTYMIIPEQWFKNVDWHSVSFLIKISTPHGIFKSDWFDGINYTSQKGFIHQ